MESSLGPICEMFINNYVTNIKTKYSFKLKITGSLRTWLQDTLLLRET